MLNVKALAVLDCRSYITEHFGVEAHEQIRAAMRERDRAIVYDESLSPLRWIDLEAVINHAIAMDAVLGRGDGKVREAMLQELASKHFTGIYRAMFQSATPKDIVRKLASIWNRYYDTGEAPTEFLDDTHAISRIVNCPEVPRGHELLLIPYMEAVLTLSGVRRIHIEHTRCVADGADCCVLEYRWE